jgi:hypothetical protein
MRFLRCKLINTAPILSCRDPHAKCLSALLTRSHAVKNRLLTLSCSVSVNAKRYHKQHHEFYVVFVQVCSLVILPAVATKEPLAYLAQI